MQVCHRYEYKLIYLPEGFMWCDQLKGLVPCISNSRAIHIDYKHPNAHFEKLQGGLDNHCTAHL